MNAAALSTSGRPLIVLGARQAVLLGLLAVALALGVNALRPAGGIPLVADWSPAARLKAAGGESLVLSIEQAYALFASRQALFVDARSPQLYADGHIAGALNLPWQRIDTHIGAFLEQVPDTERPIIAYCDDESCELSEELARMLQDLGYRQVRVIVNGWSAWREAGHPTRSGEAP
jgi:rhodanese-related sulfurtransferase